MRRYVVFLGVCVIVAMALVFSFAPWAGAFSVTSESALTATLAIMVPVVCVVVLGLVAWWAFAPTKPVHFELDSVKAEDVESALWGMADTHYIGPVAREAAEQLNRLQMRVRACRRTLGATFDEGSMTFDHYWGGVEATRDAGVRTLASVAMRLSSFDVYEYERARAKEYSPTYVMLSEELDGTRAMVESNEALVSELVRLDVEVGRLEAGSSDKAADQVLDELREMVEQVDFYR